MYIITAKHKGNKITRKAVSDTQASAIINQLLRKGCTEIGIKEEKGMQQKEFVLYKRRLLSLIPGKLQDIPNRGVKIKFFRSSLIEQIEKEKDWQFTREQAAELIRMAIYPDLRSEEERMQYEDFLMNGLDRVMSEDEE